MINTDFLKLAVKRQLPIIVAGLPDIACPSDMSLELTGVPGCGQVNVKAARRYDGTIRAIVVSLDGVPLAHSDWVVVDMEPPEAAKLVINDGSIEGAHGTRWYPVTGTGLEPEPQSVDAAGRDVIAMVNTRINCWVLACPDCGRNRYASRNNVHKVFQCRICGKKRRRQTQTEWQRNRRQQHKFSSSTPTTTSPTNDVHEPSAPD